MENLAPLSPNDKKPKKRASRKQIEANRKNGKLGGPKTKAGKLRVSQNAIKHALLAKEVVIEVGDGSENRNDFDVLFNELISYYDPQGPIERILVEKMAVNQWRHRRFIRAENGEIRKNLDSVRMQARSDRIEEHDSSKTKLLPLLNNPELMNNVLELKDVLRFIKDALEEVKLLCYVSDRTLAGMTKYFGQDLDSVSALSIAHNSVFKVKAEEFLDNDKDPRKIPDIKMTVGFLLKKLKRENERVTTHLKRIENREEMNISSQILCLNVPPKEIIDKFIRYESSILRQFYKAMHELERIQRRRQGEFVPSPMNIEIGVENN